MDKLITDHTTDHLVMVKEIPIMELPTLGPVEVNIGKEHVYFTDADGNHHCIKTAIILNFKALT